MLLPSQLFYVFGSSKKTYYTYIADIIYITILKMYDSPTEASIGTRHLFYQTHITKNWPSVK